MLEVRHFAEKKKLSLDISELACGWFQVNYWGAAILLLTCEGIWLISVRVELSISLWIKSSFCPPPNPTRLSVQSAPAAQHSPLPWQDAAAQ